MADDCLLSAGGDHALFVWSLSAQKLRRKVDISALLDHLVVGRELAVLKILVHRGLAVIQASGVPSLLVFTLADLIGDGSAEGRTIDLGAPVLDMAAHGESLVVLLDAGRGKSAPVRLLDARGVSLVDGDAASLSPLLAATDDSAPSLTCVADLVATIPTSEEALYWQPAQLFRKNPGKDGAD